MMSGPALAKRLGLSRQYISKAEQGIYSSLNPALLRWCAQQNGFNVASVAKRYRKFQNAKRRETLLKVGPHKLTLRPDFEPEGQSFERWRSGYWTSPGQFSVAFCIHPDLVEKFEEGITKTMPKQLREILEANGLLEGEALSGPVTASDGATFL